MAGVRRFPPSLLERTRDPSPDHRVSEPPAELRAPFGDALEYAACGGHSELMRASVGLPLEHALDFGGGDAEVLALWWPWGPKTEIRVAFTRGS